MGNIAPFAAKIGSSENDAKEVLIKQLGFVEDKNNEYKGITFELGFNKHVQLCVQKRPSELYEVFQTFSNPAYRADAPKAGTLLRDLFDAANLPKEEFI